MSADLTLITNGYKTLSTLDQVAIPTSTGKREESMGKREDAKTYVPTMLKLVAACVQIEGIEQTLASLVISYAVEKHFIVNRPDPNSEIVVHTLNLGGGFDTLKMRLQETSDMDRQAAFLDSIGRDRDVVEASEADLLSVANAAAISWQGTRNES